MKITTKLLIRLDDARVRRRLGEANARALKIAGMRVQEKTQREMSNRAPLNSPRQWKIGTKDGRDLVALVKRVPRGDKVTSWKTGRNSKGFLRADVRYFFDLRRGSVVIGPSKAPAINQLHEFGGSRPIHFYATGGGPKKSRKFKDPIFGQLATGKLAGRTPTYTIQRRVKPRRFMAQGIAKAKSGIPKAFRDTLKGP
jgi:hypothetical protein